MAQRHGGKKSRRYAARDEVNIIPMMDMMVLILVFLLNFYSTSTIVVQGEKDFELPLSSAVAAPKLAVNVVITMERVLVDGMPVLEFDSVSDGRGGAIPAFKPGDVTAGANVTTLAEVFAKKVENAKRLASLTNTEDLLGFKGEMLIQCDKRVPYDVLRSVMYTAGQQQFSEFHFVVIKGAG